MGGTRRVVIKPSEFLSGAPMERMPGVRDWKVIYPETGFPTKTLIMGIVEIDPGAHTPLHRHNCEEVYFVLQGRGYIESEGERYEFEAGDAIYNRENTAHHVFNHRDGAGAPVRGGGHHADGAAPAVAHPKPL
jgi:quercetin dioxygenase-like cupin family protein